MDPYEQEPIDLDGHPDLLALVRGELGNAQSMDADVHLAGCDECRQALVDLVVANGLLSRAARTESEGSTVRAEPLPTPPPLRLPPARRAGRRMAVLAAAAAVVVGLAGVVGTGLLDRDRPGDEPTVAPYTAVALDPVEGSAVGRARIVGGGGDRIRLTIEAPELPGARDGRFYYAWLLDPSTNKMLPLGQVGPDGTASFDLDHALVTAYSAIDVSLEDDDGDPGHSVTSVLRGSYDQTAGQSRS